MKVYKKIHKMANIVSFFCNHEWEFTNDHTQKLWKKLSKTDQAIYNFNMQDMDWASYFHYYIRGMRIYLFKDDLSTLDSARKKWKRWVHDLSGVIEWQLIFNCPIFQTPFRASDTQDDHAGGYRLLPMETIRSLGVLRINNFQVDSVVGAGLFELVVCEYNLRLTKGTTASFEVQHQRRLSTKDSVLVSDKLC